ncbi:MAG: alpha/beta hydrolase family protein, partial [Opitutaceae bacterium]
IGMGGLSWGGWQSTIVSALDDRIAAAASAAGCNVGHRRWFHSRGPGGAGQHYPGFLASGLDHGDFFALIAPRAFLRVSTTRDFKSIQGARETYAEYRPAFEALGAADKLDATEDDAEHGYTRKNHEAVFRFYGKHLAHPGSATFELVEGMTAEDTKIAPTGQVATSFHGATAFDFNREEAVRLLEKLEHSRRSSEVHLANVRRSAERLAGIQIQGGDSVPVFVGRYRRDRYAVEMYVLQGEAGYVVPLLLFVPEGTGKRPAVIYVHPKGKTAKAAVGGEVERLVRGGYIVAVPDVAGTGETQNTRGNQTRLQYVAITMGRSMVGLQAGDVMRVRRFLQSRAGLDVGPIGAVGIGNMGSAVVHAAALDTAIKGLVLVDAPLSYRSIVLNRFYTVDVTAMVAGALTAYDLPDLIGSIAPRRVALIDPRDQMLKTAAPALVEGELEFPRAAFAHAGAKANFRVTAAGGDLAAMVDWCLEWNERQHIP